jgi:WD40 repeat protein
MAVGLLCWLDVAAHVAGQEKTQGISATVRLDRHGDPLPAGATARLGTTRFRLNGRLHILGYSADDKSLWFLDQEGKLYLMDVRSGKIRHRPITLRTQHFGGWQPWGFQPEMSISGDGKTFAFFRNFNEGMGVIDLVAGREFAMIPDGELFQRINGGIGLGQMVYGLSHDGQRLFFSGQQMDQCMMIGWFDTASGKVLHRGKSTPGTQFTAGAFSPDAGTVYAVEGQGNGPRGRLRSWSVLDGREFKAVDVPGFRTLAFLPDGKSVLGLGYNEAGIPLVATATGKEIRRFGKKHQDYQSLALSPDGKTLYAAGSGRIHQWDVASGKELRVLKLPTQATPQVRISRDGKVLAAAGMHYVSLWDTSNGKEISVASGHSGPVGFVTFARDGRLVSTACDPSVRMWNLEGMKELRRFTPAAPSVVNNFPFMINNWQFNDNQIMMEAMGTSGQISPDGKIVAATWTNRNIHLWNADTGKLLKELQDQSEQQVYNGSHVLAFRPDSRELASGFGDGRVRLWDAATAKKKRSIVWHHFSQNDPNNQEWGSISAVTYSPDGRMLAAAGYIMNNIDSRPVVRVWELATLEERLRVRVARKQDALSQFTNRHFFGGYQGNNQALGLVMSADGRTLALGAGTTIYLWDLRRGKEIRQFAGPQLFARALAFSPDGKLLAAGKLDGSIRLWRVQTGELLCDIPGHDLAVCSVAFSPDGKRLVSGSMDSTVLAWDVDFLEREAQMFAKAAEDLNALWAELSGKDAARAHQAIDALSGRPEAVVFLKSKIRPVPPLEKPRVDQCLKDLADARYFIRERATRSLAQLDTLAQPALQAILTKQSPLEVRRRAEILLKQLQEPIQAADLLGPYRAIEVLEKIGTNEAKQFLQAMAQGAPGHRLTEEARTTLERLRTQQR